MSILTMVLLVLIIVLIVLIAVGRINTTYGIGAIIILILLGLLLGALNGRVG